MNTEHIAGIVKRLFRGLPLLVFASLACAALGYSAYRSSHHAMAGALQRVSPFTLVGWPTNRSVLAGGVARYRISIVRRRYRKRILLAATTSNPPLSAHLSTTGARVGKRILSVSGSRAVLTVRTRLGAPAGRYIIRVRGTAGRFTAQLALGLTIGSPAPASFTVTGNFGELWPGSASGVNLAVTNPNPKPISISRLAVSLRAISAPRATRTLPCSAADFSIRQFSGSYPLLVPAQTTMPLSALGVAPAQWPQIAMLDRPVNQNGCRGALITLSYMGTATL